MKSERNKTFSIEDLEELEGLPAFPTLEFEVVGRVSAVYKYEKGQRTDEREISAKGLPGWRVLVRIPWDDTRVEGVVVFCATAPEVKGGSVVTFDDLVIAPWASKTGKSGFGMLASGCRVVGKIRKEYERVDGPTDSFPQDDDADLELN